MKTEMVVAIPKLQNSSHKPIGDHCPSFIYSLVYLARTQMHMKKLTIFYCNFFSPRGPFMAEVDVKTVQAYKHTRCHSWEYPCSTDQVFDLLR